MADEMSETRDDFRDAHVLLIDQAQSSCIDYCEESMMSTREFAVCVLGATPDDSVLASQDLFPQDSSGNLENANMNNATVVTTQQFQHEFLQDSSLVFETADVNIVSSTPDTRNMNNATVVTTQQFQHEFLQDSSLVFETVDVNIVSSTPDTRNMNNATVVTTQQSQPEFLQNSSLVFEIADDLPNAVESADDDEIRDPDYAPSNSEIKACSSSSDEGNTDSIPDGQGMFFFTETEALSTVSQLTDSTSDVDKSKTQPGRSTQRKAVRNETQWKANLRKRRRNVGEEYFTRTGKQVRRKTTQDIQCNCSDKCNSKVTFATRQEQFSNFWKLGDWSAQNAYISGLVQVNEINKRDIRDRRSRRGCEGPVMPKKSKRNFTRTYNVHNTSGITTKVCKNFFLDTFQISNGRLDRALKTKNTHKSPRSDQRGKKEPPNKTPKILIEELHNFINAFPKYKSHYCRENGNYGSTERLYFAPGLKVAKLYKLYVEDCLANARKSLSDQMFRKILKRDFKLSFHSPLKDTCKTCDIYKIQIESAHASQNVERMIELQKERDHHHERAETVGKQLKEDKQKQNTKVICFDLQKTLPTPVLTTNVVYYKRQLWTYNLGIHEEQSGNAFMCMWHEGQASRGPNEVGSCLIKYIRESDSPEHLIAYTDTCGGQNRNIKMCLFFMNIVNDDKNNITVIDQKFFICGHSYMSCDRDFGAIEQHKSSNPYIFEPKHWVQLVKDSSDKFTVAEMKSNDIVHVEQLLKNIVHRKSDLQGGKVEWLKIQWLRVRQESPFKIFFKYTLNEEAPFRYLYIGKRPPREGKPANTNQINLSDPLPQLYPKGHSVKTAKLNDLKSLLPYIPPINHAFYHSLLEDCSCSANESNDDIVNMEEGEIQA